MTSSINSLAKPNYPEQRLANVKRVMSLSSEGTVPYEDSEQSEADGRGEHVQAADDHHLSTARTVSETGHHVG